MSWHFWYFSTVFLKRYRFTVSDDKSIIVAGRGVLHVQKQQIELDSRIWRTDDPGAFQVGGIVIRPARRVEDAWIVPWHQDATTCT